MKGDVWKGFKLSHRDSCIKKEALRTNSLLFGCAKILATTHVQVLALPVFRCLVYKP